MVRPFPPAKGIDRGRPALAQAMREPVRDAEGAVHSVLGLRRRSTRHLSAAEEYSPS